MVMQAAKSTQRISLALIGGTSRAAETISEDDAHAIGEHAYLDFYSEVTMDLTRSDAISSGDSRIDGRIDARMHAHRGDSG